MPRIEGANGEFITATNHMLDVHSVMHKAVTQAASEGNAYMWAASVDVGADKNVIWLRNNSLTSDLIIEWISISCSAATVVEIFVGTGTTPTPGTTVVGTNCQIQNANIAPATCYHTETSVDAGAGLTLFTSHQTAITAKEMIDYDGVLRLKYYSEVAVNVITDIALTTVNILGYFSDH